MLLRRGNASNPGFLGSLEPGVLYNDQSTKPTAGSLGTGAGQNRFPNLLPARDPIRPARHVVKAFGVPPGKGGDRKPADHGGFANKKPGPGKPGRKKKYLIHQLVSPIGLATSKKMERSIPAKGPGGGRKDAAYQKKKKEAELEEPAPKNRTVREQTLELRDGLLYQRNLLWVPEGIVRQVLESEYDSKVVGHMAQDKTIELIRRNLWWPKMNERIIDFVRSCPDCQQNKASRHQPYGQSSPLELPYAPWQSIAMDFITELPTSDNCDQLWVIIDRFTKMAHFLPLRKEGKTAAELAVIFGREVWNYHGLPTDVVSDRDSRFTSETWKEFLRLCYT